MTDIKKLKNKEEYEKFVECAFLIGNLSTNEIISDAFNLNNLWTIIIYEANAVSSLFYQNNINELKSFLENILKPKNKSSLFDLEFGKFALKSNIEKNYIFNRSDLIEILVQHFKVFVKSTDHFTNDFWNYYHACKITYNQHSHTLHPKAKELFKEFMIKDLDNFLIALIHTPQSYERNSDEDKIGLHSIIIVAVFGSYDAFEKFLKSKKIQKLLIKPTIFLTEFLILLNELKANNYQQIAPPMSLTFPPLIQRLEERSYE